MNSVQFWAPYWTSVLLKSSLLIICLSVRLPVSHFSKEESLVFSDFFHNGRYLWSLFSKKPHFCSNLGNLLKSISDKILVLEIWTKIPLTNEIAGSFKKWYLKKELNDKVYFWHADKHQSFLQVKSIIWVCLLDMSKVPEITS